MFQLKDVLKPRAARLLKASICYCRLRVASLCPSQCWLSTSFPMTSHSRSRTATFKGNFIIFTGKGSRSGRHLKCACVFSSGFWFQWFFKVIITVALLLPSGVKSCRITESLSWRGALETSQSNVPAQAGQKSPNFICPSTTFTKFQLSEWGHCMKGYSNNQRLEWDRSGPLDSSEGSWMKTWHKETSHCHINMLCHHQISQSPCFCAPDSVNVLSNNCSDIKEINSPCNRIYVF